MAKMSDKEYYTRILDVERRYREDMRKYNAIACSICALGAVASCSGAFINALTEAEPTWLAGYGLCTLGFGFFGYKFLNHFKELAKKSDLEINYEEILKDIEEKMKANSVSQTSKNSAITSAEKKFDNERSR
jgi:hypothetical protein